MSLYDYPEIYATLLYPEPDLLEALYGWLDDHLEGPREKLLDPCCGPATWLLPFAVRDWHVAGNDRLAGMVAEARRRLEPWSSEIVRGDMRRLRLRTGPFDVALNLHASVGHLDGPADVLAHLRSVHAQLRPGGLYLVGVCVYDGDRPDRELRVLYESDPTALPSGGTAAVRYESVCRDPVRGEETIRLLLLTHGVTGCPARLDEEYVLRAFTEPGLRAVLEEAGGFELCAVHQMEEDGYPDVGLEPGCGDVTLVLRRHE